MKTYHNPTRHLIGALSLMLVASASPLFASDTDTSTGSTRSTTSTGTTASTARSMGEHTQLARSDRRLVEKLGKLGMEEVALSKIAAERTTRADVRSFAQQMVDAHQKVNTELTQLATAKGLTLPMADQPDLGKWTKKDAEDFDEDYLEKMIDAHEDSIELLKDDARESKDTEIASFARTHLPSLQEHLLKAQALKKSLK